MESKHKNPLAANAKGRLGSKLAKDIMIAARQGLIRRPTRACGWWWSKPARCPHAQRHTGSRHQKGQASRASSAFEHVIYEGYAPHRVRDGRVLTDNVNRAAYDMRVLFREDSWAPRARCRPGTLTMWASSKPKATTAGADAEMAAIEAERKTWSRVTKRAPRCS